jgi:hypothetical protein
MLNIRYQTLNMTITIIFMLFMELNLLILYNKHYLVKLIHHLYYQTVHSQEQVNME